MRGSGDAPPTKLRQALNGDRSDRRVRLDPEACEAPAEPVTNSRA